MNEQKQESSCRDEQRLCLSHALILIHFPEGEGQFMLHVPFWIVFCNFSQNVCKVFANRLLLTHMGVIYIYQWLSSLSFICLSLCLCRHYAPPLNLISLCLSGRFLSLSVLILAPCVCVVACRAEWETEEAKLCPAAACVRRRDFCLFGWVDAQTFATWHVLRKKWREHLMPFHLASSISRCEISRCQISLLPVFHR